MIRLCPKCGDYYADAQLAFCLADGTPLTDVNPRDEKWNQGSRVIAEKAKRLSNRKRKLWTRRIVLGALTTLILTLVIANSYSVETTPPPLPVPLSPSPSPSSSSSLSPSPSPSPSPSASPSASPSPSPSRSQSPSPSPSPSASPSPYTSPPVFFKISGRVLSGSQPVGSVNIVVEGTKTARATTDGNGYYTLSDLPEGGSYTVTPKAEMKFNPPSRSFDKLRRDESADFIAKTEVYKISGRVLSLAGPRGGVTVSIEGSRLTSTTTDNNGYYSFGELRAGGDYTVTPRGQSKFAPPRRSFNDLQRDGSVDFVQIDETPSPSPSPGPSPFPSPTCTGEDQDRALNAVRSFEPSWRRKIEGERAKIIAANVPDGTVEKQASLGRIEFQYRFLKPCRAADVQATYEWLVSYSPVGSSHRTNKTVPGQRRFACGKFLGAWVCR